MFRLTGRNLKNYLPTNSCALIVFKGRNANLKDITRHFKRLDPAWVQKSHGNQLKCSSSHRLPDVMKEVSVLMEGLASEFLPNTKWPEIMKNIPTRPIWPEIQNIGVQVDPTKLRDVNILFEVENIMFSKLNGQSRKVMQNKFEKTNKRVDIENSYKEFRWAYVTNLIAMYLEQKSKGKVLIDLYYPLTSVYARILTEQESATPGLTASFDLCFDGVSVLKSKEADKAGNLQRIIDLHMFQSDGRDDKGFHVLSYVHNETYMTIYPSRLVDVLNDLRKIYIK